VSQGCARRSAGFQQERLMPQEYRLNTQIHRSARYTRGHRFAICVMAGMEISRRHCASREKQLPGGTQLNRSGKQLRSKRSAPFRPLRGRGGAGFHRTQVVVVDRQEWETRLPDLQRGRIGAGRSGQKHDHLRTRIRTRMLRWG